ncbi:TPA: hypothetical protein ACG0MV_004382 [Enterobacter hormaechei subsp. steigerwaltii]
MGGINLYLYAPNALGWVDPWGLSRYSSSGKYKLGTILGRTIYKILLTYILEFLSQFILQSNRKLRMVEQMLI